MPPWSKAKKHLTAQREDIAKRRKESQPERSIGEILRFDGKKWNSTALKSRVLTDSTCSIKLHLGGEIKVHSNMIKRSDRINVEEELHRRQKFFRECPIQGGREHRANLFFHQNATHCAEEMQPENKYGSTRMMAISYKGFPDLRCVSKKLAEHCSVPCWNVGVDAVFNRDGNDSIGYHADNDQGDEKILSKLGCCIVRLCGSCRSRYSYVSTYSHIYVIASRLRDIFPTKSTPNQNSGGTRGKEFTGCRR
jgi:hypothetical protein